MVTIKTFKQGFADGLKITWELAKVVIPVYFIITFLKYTPVLPWISDCMAPVMCLMGLPGEASVPLVMGYTLNIYASIGAVLPLGLNTKQITIISVMILMAHSLPIETAVNKKTGVRVRLLLLVRFSLSFAVGAALNNLI